MCPVWASSTGEMPTHRKLLAPETLKTKRRLSKIALTTLNLGVSSLLLQENYLSAIKTFSGPLEDIKLCELNHNDPVYRPVFIEFITPRVLISRMSTELSP